LSDVVDVIGKLYPKYNIPEAIFDELYTYMLKDKKNENGKINCTFLKQIGQYSIDNICTQDELYESLRYYTSL
jgi:3-dehydroquinate synthase